MKKGGGGSFELARLRHRYCEQLLRSTGTSKLCVTLLLYSTAVFHNIQPNRVGYLENIMETLTTYSFA